MTRQTAMLLYPGFTALDAIGPYHALAALPDHEFSFVAEHAGPVSDSGKATLHAQRSIDDVDHVDLLIVPGGIPAVTMARSGHPLIDWIRTIHPTTTWTTSVCTGALMLGAAGVLDGLTATTHWFSHAELADYGAIPTDRRVVRDGKVITAAGVSAGIDMALILTEIIAGTDYAQAIQLDMEYDPQPPFNSGHPNNAPTAVTTQLRAMYEAMLHQLRTADGAPARCHLRLFRRDESRPHYPGQRRLKWSIMSTGTARQHLQAAGVRGSSARSGNQARRRET